MLCATSLASASGWRGSERVVRTCTSPSSRFISTSSRVSSRTRLSSESWTCRWRRSAPVTCRSAAMSCIWSWCCWNAYGLSSRNSARCPSRRTPASVPSALCCIVAMASRCGSIDSSGSMPEPSDEVRSVALICASCACGRSTGSSSKGVASRRSLSRQIHSSNLLASFPRISGN